MSDAVLYRKYRPKKFSEVLGQEPIVTALKGAIEQKNIGHAYLFAGTRGTGKTSLARIFADTIGTKEVDLYEIDAASNRGVDDVRALREEVHTVPFDSPYKVYIVDEVHMLTKEAFNALLKTLEEPPAHVIFILATTEQEKLPDTIISRCQTFTFRKPTTALLKKMILTVSKKEGYTLEQSSAELLALLANGSYRDAHGHLQQACSVSKDMVISPEEIEAVTGAPQSTALLALIEHIATGDLDKSLADVHTLMKKGTDIRTMLTLLLRLLRAILLLRSAPSMKQTLEQEFTQEEFTAIEMHALQSQKTINSTLLRSLLDAYMRVGTTYTPELPLEIALIDYFENTT